MQQYTTLSTREKMLELHRQGVKAPEIARRFGLRQAREAVGDAFVLFVEILAVLARAQMGVDGGAERGHSPLRRNS